MPLTPEQKRLALLAEGSDPELYDIDDNTLETIPRVKPRVKSSQANNNPMGAVASAAPAAPEKQFGIGETVGRHAAKGVIPALAGAGGWALAAPLAPETFGLSFLVPLAASIAAGWGTHAVQEEALNRTDIGKQFNLDTAAAAQQNPTAATVGNLAGSLPIMRPSVGMVKDAARGLMAGNVARNPALANVGVGAGIGTGFGLYEEATDPNGFNPLRFAANAAGGALINKPADNALARAVGLHPYVRPSLYGRPEGQLPEVVVNQPEPFPAPLYETLGPVYVERPYGMPSKEFNASYPYLAQQKLEAAAEAGSKLTPRAERAQAKGREVKVTPDDAEALQLLSKAPLLKRSRRQEMTGESPEVGTRTKDIGGGKKIYYQEEGQGEVEPLHATQLEEEQGLVPALRVGGHLFKGEVGDTHGNVYNQAKEFGLSQGELYKAQPGFIDLRNNQFYTRNEASSKFNRRYSRTYRQEEAEQTQPTVDDYAESIDKQRLLASNRELAEHTGAELEVLPSTQKTFKTSEGKNVYGEADIEQGKATITQTRPDTGFHELTGHLLFENLPAKLQERYLRGVRGDEKFKQWDAVEKAAGRAGGEREFLAQATGKDDLRRIAMRDSNFLRDVTSWFRVNVSRNAKAADVVRQLSNRAYYGKGGEVKPQPGRSGTPISGQETRQEEATPFSKMREEVFGKDTKQPTAEERQAEVEATRQKDLDIKRYRPAQETTETEADIFDKVLAMKGDEFMSYAKGLKGGMTSESYRLGESLKTQEDVDRLRGMSKAAGEEVNRLLSAGDVDEAVKLSTKQQFFNEAIGAATGKGSAGGELRRERGEAYKPKFEQEEGQTETSLTETDQSKKGFARFLESSFDKVERVSKPLAQAFRNWEARRDQHLGLRNITLHDLAGYSRDEVASVVDKHDKYYRGLDSTKPTFTGEQKEISDILQDYYGTVADIRRAAKLTIDGREAGKNPYYIPHQLNDKTLDMFINKARTPQALAAQNKWAAYIVETSGGKVDLREAKRIVSDYVNALGGERKNYKSVNFGAIRKAAGYGLPKELRELDPIRSIEKYGRRAAADLALFQELESKPEVAAMLKIPDPRTGVIPAAPEGADLTNIDSADEVRKAMKWVMNSFAAGANENPRVAAFVRLVNNALLGPATGIRDTVSILNNMLPYIHSTEGAGAIFKGLGNYQQNYRDAIRTAAAQPNIDKAQFNDLVEAPDRVTAFLRKGADVLRKYQGREAIENFNRTVTFGIGRELAKVNIAAARAGDSKAQAFLKKFSTLVEGDATKLTGDNLDNAVDQIAKNFVDRNQGTYGGRGLPTGAMEGSLAPFFALQKWSMEKSNVIYQDVVKPFMSGENRLPMLTYTLGSLLTGAAIQELNKLLTNRKPQDPTVGESLWSKDPKQYVSQMATLMQLGSYMGIVSDIAKAGTDIGLRGKAPRNLVSFPTVTAVADLGDKVADFSEAISQGENPFDALKSFALDVMAHNVQAVRIAKNYSVSSEDVKRSDKFRDMRVYRELTGEPIGEPTKANAYLDSDVKKFKRTGDVGEAAALMPQLLKKFEDKVKENPDRALAFLRGLKANNYQTMPNPEGMPGEFAKFYQFLKETQGEEKARERLEDYIKQNAVNTVKSQMVPSIAR